MSSFFRGKVILTGEHSVVYGGLAVLASLELGVQCIASEGVLTAPQAADPYLQHLLRLSADILGQKELSLSLDINSTLPTQAGLGSSAAFAAAVLSAITTHYGRSLDQTSLYKLTLQAENFIHGRSSGADPAIVVHGGCLAFRQGEVTPFTSTALTEQQFFLVNSGAASESTGEMLDVVKNNSQHLEIVREISALSQVFYEDLLQNKLNLQLFNDNQVLLEKLGVVGNRAKEMIVSLKKLGASGKITGAGGLATGSGYILATHEDTAFFEKELSLLGLDFFMTTLGEKQGQHEKK